MVQAVVNSKSLNSKTTSAIYEFILPVDVGVSVVVETLVTVVASRLKMKHHTFRLKLKPRTSFITAHQSPNFKAPKTTITEDTETDIYRLL